MSIPARVVLASDDLQARTRVLDALTRKGLQVATTEPTGFSAAARGARALILDLDRGGKAALEELESLRSGEGAPAEIFGFFSHVDAELGRRARAAGCRAMPRGKFWADLPELFEGSSDRSL